MDLARLLQDDAHSEEEEERLKKVNEAEGEEAPRKPQPAKRRIKHRKHNVSGCLRAQLQFYGPKLFQRDAEGKYVCFFRNCRRRMTTNFSRHVSKHEEAGDQIDPAMWSLAQKPDGEKLYVNLYLYASHFCF
eukprot:TRINITY_DN3997_c0_g2_i2.p1 TRINITY_DN3997_c0_g2~~TRINITY_DN3997_c0_g2_i2.p1  ORF type:complete len:132 (-),score=43.49 TRINITY_DN3997_c0_g2_i2:122-517(-)